MTEHLLSLTDQLHDQVFGDQGVLNHLLKVVGKSCQLPIILWLVWIQWLEITRWILGIGTLLLLRRQPRLSIIQGTSLGTKSTLNRFREDWWFYYGPEWPDIVMKNVIS